ncbi:MAG: hypothetical protein WCQ57_00885 [Verrucomicrobiota bacterium]
MRSLLKCLCEQVSRIETLSGEAKLESEPSYTRPVAWDSLTVRFVDRSKT